MKSILLVGMICCASYSFRLRSVRRHPSGRLLCDLKSLKSKSLVYSTVNNVIITLHEAGDHHHLSREFFSFLFITKSSRKMTVDAVCLTCRLR